MQAIAERFEIRSVLGQYPGTLSGGEQQRVALARALIIRPPLLLFDEPFSALDPGTRNRLYGLIGDIRNEFGCAIVFVTHNYDEAQLLSDRIGILIRGHLSGIVPKERLYTEQWEPEARALLAGKGEKE